MFANTQNLKSRSTSQSSDAQFSEDPHREPHEKETGLHVEGGDTHFSVTSFKKVVYAKLLRHSGFSVTNLHVLDDNKREYTMDCPDKAAEHSLTVIGVTGKVPVGVSIGSPRNSNSHANLVK
jgi:hypothetical protein